MKIKNILTLIVFFSHLLLFSSETTTISGYLPGAENYEIRLHTYDDYISYKNVILDRSQIDSLGYFTLRATINETSLAFLEIEFYTTSLFISPGKSYQLIFDSIHPALEYRPYYKKEYLPFTINSEPEPKLNNLIGEFDIHFNEFINSTYNKTRMVRNIAPINNFKSFIDSAYKNSDHSYFKAYRDYKIAYLILTIAPTKKPMIFKTYLQGQPILYNNPEYMNFFNGFFGDHVSSNNRFITQSDLEYTINSLVSLHALMDTLGKDTLLRNEKLRELVAIKTLKELNGNKYFYTEAILQIIKQVSTYSKFGFHQNIAENLISEMNKLKKGAFAPYFNLPGLDGNKHDLSSFFGKPTYIGFMTTWSYASLAEYDLFDSLVKVYGNRINFITISLDKDLKVIRRFKDEKKYRWDFLYNGNQYDLLKDYEIKTFPAFILLDEHGKIIQYPAYKPSEIITSEFDKILIVK
ncbi:MAG: TlpA family protein disulfide reductase [Bacteroidales bacterium]|nr:TlpA family protein disulfide reductase [Bacteroidales bacterium]